MTARITVDIFCDRCGCWEHGWTSGKTKIRKAIRAVKALGWSRSAKGRYLDLCNKCLEEVRKENQ